jgi:hypothetical protein
VISETMARRYWPDRSPLGSRLRIGSEPDSEWRTVVGVVADVRKARYQVTGIRYQVGIRFRTATSNITTSNNIITSIRRHIVHT